MLGTNTRPPPNPSATVRFADLALIVALIAATGLVLGKDITLGALADADSAAHLMDGVLIHDWVMAGPSAWLAPMQFAEQQYGHYPTLGIGRHYPPGFAVVEAAFFAVFGISGVSARLCVMFFGCVAVLATFWFVRCVAGRLAGAMAGVMLLTLPSTTLWGRQTMLEIPTVAMLVCAAVCFQGYVAQPKKSRLASFIALALLAVMFKQTAVFLPCAAALTLLVLAWRRLVPWTHAVALLLGAGGFLALVMLSLDEACAKTLSGYHTYPDPWSPGALTFYVRALPYLVGWMVVLFAAVGAVLSARRQPLLCLFLASWFLAAYVMVTTASLKVPRFFYVGLFPLAVWSAIALQQLLECALWARARTVAALVCTGLLCSHAFLRPARHAPDYTSIVSTHREDIRDRPVLFSGLRDGDFVFAVRQNVPFRRAVVLRGSKLLYTCIAGPALDLQSYVDNEQQVAVLMRRLAIEYIFIERENVVGTVEDEWLRQYLVDGGDYQRIASHDLTGEGKSARLAAHLDVYRLVQPLTRQVDHIDIPMPRTGRPIRVSLTIDRRDRNEPL